MQVLQPCRVEFIPYRNNLPVILLREPGRHGGRVKRRTMANLFRLRAESVDEPGCGPWEGDSSAIPARRSLCATGCSRASAGSRGA